MIARLQSYVRTMAETVNKGARDYLTCLADVRRPLDRKKASKPSDVEDTKGCEGDGEESEDQRSRSRGRTSRQKKLDSEEDDDDPELQQAIGASLQQSGSPPRDTGSGSSQSTAGGTSGQGNLKAAMAQYQQSTQNVLCWNWKVLKELRLRKKIAKTPPTSPRVPKTKGTGKSGESKPSTDSEGDPKPDSSKDGQGGKGDRAASPAARSPSTSMGPPPLPNLGDSKFDERFN